MTTQDKKNGRNASNAAARTTRSDFTGNSVVAQRRRLLAALEIGPLSTIEIRRDLDILAPAVRVFELRHIHGKNILSVWRDEWTDAGQMHRVVQYVLQPAPQLDLL